MKNNKTGAPVQSDTVKERYEETKKSTDEVLKASKEPLDPKDAGETKSTIPMKDDDYAHDYNSNIRLYDLGGLNSYDGNESFMQTVKHGVEWLIGRVEYILNWILDFVFNRVTSLRRNLTRLKYNFNDNGINLKPVKYPRTVTRLAQAPNVPKTPDFALKSMEDSEKLYTKCMGIQTQMASLVRTFGSDVTREQLLNFAESLSSSYVTGMGGRKVKDDLYEINFPTGFLNMKCFIDRRRGYNGFTLTEYYSQKVNIRVPTEFMPSADVVQRLILKADVHLMNIERVHKSQRSFANNFKASITPLKNGVRMYPEPVKEEILKYYRWLINYQNKSVNIPLNHHISVLSACVDLAKVQIQIPRG